MTQLTSQDPIVLVCPSCRHKATFQYVGTQSVPDDVAERLELPLSITLWFCSHCDTTRSDIDLGLTKTD